MLTSRLHTPFPLHKPNRRVQQRPNLTTGGSCRQPALTGPKSSSSAGKKVAKTSNTKKALPRFQGTQASTSVQLLVYNIDRWGYSAKCSKWIKKEVDGIFHTGVLVHGKEYWFDHRVDSVSLTEFEFAQGFEPVCVHDMGSTCLKPEEIEQLVYGHMQQTYSQETYDCFNNNCHHFANELCLELTGCGVPQWYLDQGEQGLCNLGNASADARQDARRKVARVTMISWGRYSKNRLVKGTRGQEQDAGEVLEPMLNFGSIVPVFAQGMGGDMESEEVMPHLRSEVGNGLK